MLADDFTRLIGDRLDGLTLVKGTLQLPGTFLVQHYLRLLLSQNYKVRWARQEPPLLLPPRLSLYSPATGSC